MDTERMVQVPKGAMLHKVWHEGEWYFSIEEVLSWHTEEELTTFWRRLLL